MPRMKLLLEITLNFLVAVVLVALAGCSRNYTVQQRPITNGRVGTDGMVIAAEDGSFLLKHGEEFAPPFQNSLFEEGASYPPLFILGKSDVVNMSEKALDRGAKPVRIHSPRLDEPLYGVLFLSSATSTSYGPASRSYLIRVPDEYIDNARDGQISVVYEKSGYKYGNWDVKVPAWVLWMSDQKFY